MKILPNFRQASMFHCVKSVRIWSFSGPHFPALRLNVERYEIAHCIQSEWEKMRTRKTPNTVTFHAVLDIVQTCILQCLKKYFSRLCISL